MDDSLSHLAEEFHPTIPNGDDYRLISNESIASEADIPEMNVNTIDEILKVTTGSSAPETPTENPDKLKAQETMIPSTGSESLHSLNGSQGILNEDFGLSFVTNQPSESSRRSTSKADPNAAVTVPNELTVESNQPADTQSSTFSRRSVDRNNSELESVNEDSPFPELPKSSAAEEEDRPKVTTENGFNQSGEIQDNVEVKDVQMGVGEEVKLGIFAVARETENKGDELAKDLSSVSVEETLPTHKTCAQVQETDVSIFPVLIDIHKGDKCDSSQANAAELEKAEIHTEAVESLPIKLSNTKSIIDETSEVPVEEFMLAEVKPSKPVEPILEVEFTDLSENFTDTSNCREIQNTQPTQNAQLSDGSSHDKENATLPCAGTNGFTSLKNGNDYATEENEEELDEELDFDTKYALFVEKVLPGHKMFYLPASPSKNKKMVFRRGGTLDQRRTVPGSPLLWNPLVNTMQIKSATLEAPCRKRLQPKPSINDDYLFPNSVTPSKVEKAISADASANNQERNQYDVPFMDDDAFVPKKYRSLLAADDDSSCASDYSNADLLRTEHMAKMDETLSQMGLNTIDGSRNINHKGGSRRALGLRICGCLRRRR